MNCATGTTGRGGLLQITNRGMGCVGVICPEGLRRDADREWESRRTGPGVCSRPVQREAGDTVVVAANPDVVAHSDGRAHALHRGRSIRAAEPREGERFRIHLEHCPAGGARWGGAGAGSGRIGAGGKELAIAIPVDVVWQDRHRQFRPAWFPSYLSRAWHPGQLQWYTKALRGVGQEGDR